MPIMHRLLLQLFVPRCDTRAPSPFRRFVVWLLADLYRQIADAYCAAFISSTSSAQQHQSAFHLPSLIDCLPSSRRLLQRPPYSLCHPPSSSLPPNLSFHYSQSSTTALGAMKAHDGVRFAVVEGAFLPDVLEPIEKLVKVSPPPLAKANRAGSRRRMRHCRCSPT